MIYERDFLLEHTGQHWQSGCQKKLCFSANHFWSSLNPFTRCQYPFFSCCVAGLGSFLSPVPEPQESSSGTPWYFLPETSGRTILPSCNVEHNFRILSCHDWPKSYCMNNLLFNLFRSLWFTSLKIIHLLHDKTEKVYNLTELWNMHSPKAHNS